MNSAHLFIDVHCSNGAKNYRFSSTAVSMILGFEELKYSNIAPQKHAQKCDLFFIFYFRFSEIIFKGEMILFFIFYFKFSEIMFKSEIEIIF